MDTIVMNTEGGQQEKMLDTAPASNDTVAPMNFSEVTPCQFGISVQSFIPQSSSPSKYKSRLAQIKARRRSSVGVRGSPETNSLIRFIAQQRMKTPPANHTLQVSVTQCLEECNFWIRTLCLDSGKENHPPRMTPTPSKRRRLGPCEVEISEASTPILPSLKEQEGNTHKWLICAFKVILSAGNDSTGASTFKKKKVRFGGPLSPELFDKNLPPSTPLQKGGTPARAPTPGGSFQLRSLLKTPQRNEAQTPQAQPDLSSPTVFGASPIFAKSGNHRPKCLGEFSEDKDGKGYCTLYNVCSCQTVLPQQPEESQPVKRSVRSAAKSASGKMKMTSTVTRRWNKEVDRSLYGSREYASKIPTLSPITERLSFTSQAIAAPESPSINCTGKRNSVLKDHQMSHAAEGNGQGDQAASQHESKSSTNSQVKEGLGQMDLAPWQADFNFEDVFKIVATRGQRSVRRSLRNKNTIADSSNSAGLTWLPLSSPESSRVTRRRTKGRQVGDALSVQSSLPVEAQDNAS
uniref:Cell division cycle associated 2 n=1 Tax=Mastacembelus armatus TaxID=205130 RepID=A0A7N8WNY9_9TELE